MDDTTKATFDLVALLRIKFPGKRLFVDFPEGVGSSGWIDEVGPLDYCVQVHADGYGLYANPDDALFSRPDEIFATVELLMARIDGLLAEA